MRRLLFAALAVLAVGSFAIAPASANEHGVPDANSENEPASDNENEPNVNGNEDGGPQNAYGNNENSDRPDSGLGSVNAGGDNSTVTGKNPNR